MLFLILSIITSTYLVLMFKVFQQYRVDSFQAIVVNYIVCVATGFVATGDSPFATAFWTEDWFPYGIALGLCFILGFNILSETVRALGVTIASVAQKMSLLLSVLFAMLYFHESASGLKIAGLLCAFAAIILTNIPAKGEDGGLDTEHLKKYGYLVALTFGIGGLLEIILQYVEKEVAPQGNDASFIIFAFGMAFVFGAGYWLFHIVRGNMDLKMKNVGWGVILGVPNFFSLYTLMRALSGMEASVVFPIANVGVILLSAAAAMVLFKERLSLVNLLGVLSAVAAILAIALA